MGCSQSKDHVLHTSHTAAKSSGKGSVKDKKIAMKKEMANGEMVKHVTNERKEKDEAMEEEKEEHEHEPEDEPFYSADEEEVNPPKNDYDDNPRGALCP